MHINSPTRRGFLRAAAGTSLAGLTLHGATIPSDLRTPCKLNRLVVRASGQPGAFDEKAVDCPFVFRHEGQYYMTFVAFDGKGYQTGLASSANLLDWKSEGLILGRDPHSELTRYNAAMNWIVRENGLFSEGRLKKIRGRYLGVYHAYPQPGYEQGAAVIGLCWSADLRKWELDPPCLRPEDGAEWERGGLYKPCLVEENGVFHLFYNAKTAGQPWHEQTGVASSRDLRTWTRHDANPILRNGPAGSPDEWFASDPCVLRHGDEWAIFYFGLDAKGVARDLVALSSDLRKTEKCDGALVDVGTLDAVDGRYAHKPSMICRNGVLYHFYCAVSKDDTRGISVATSKPVVVGR
ncbi:MAG: hypothetical protein P4K98_06935 [Bryobacteraceae bacterium]|nr:hypothetical protein [Bryobacteraceae bacterium]